MAMKLTSGLIIKAKEVVDDRLVLTKAQMLSMKKSGMPEVYFALCSEDGQMYFYDKNAEPNEETGCFKKMTSSSSGGSSVLDETIKSSVDVGGVLSGMELKADTSFTDVMKLLLSENNKPEIIVPDTKFYEKGETIENLNVDITVNKTTTDIKSIEIQYLDQTDIVSEDIVESNKKTITLSNITEDADITVIVIDKNSVENKLTFKVCAFIEAIYYGYTDDINISTLDDFNKVLTDKNGINISNTIDGKYLAIVVPDNISISNIEDKHFDYIDSFDEKTIVINEKNYKAYTSDTIITCSDFVYTITFNKE